MRTQSIAPLIALLLSMPVMAADEVRSVTVQTNQLASAQTIQGTITGYQSADHNVQVAAGQTLTVHLDTSNTSSYFNVTAAGADQAMFIGSTSGNDYQGVMPSSGVYTIRVYMMRNAARRDEVAKYTLNIKIK
ncbi:hypothetical protein [Herminiimonas aquatilis]|uniref:DNA breaking-rejoining protein n=1 Tax=Herminiimonas aquatilis TaxID=345342 RepID=A0ABW2J2D5_9BURK